MAAKDKATRRLVGTKARYDQLLQQSAAERTATAEAAAATRRRQLEDEIDPRRELDPEERARRVTYLIRAQMADLSLKAVKARREKLAAQRQAKAEAELNAILSVEAGAR